MDAPPPTTATTSTGSSLAVTDPVACRPEPSSHTFYKIPCLHCHFITHWKIGGEWTVLASYDFETEEGKALACRRCNKPLEPAKRHMKAPKDGYSFRTRVWSCWACGHERNNVLYEFCEMCLYRRDGACVVGWWA